MRYLSSIKEGKHGNRRRRVLERKIVMYESGKPASIRAMQIVEQLNGANLFVNLFHDFDYLFIFFL